MDVYQSKIAKLVKWIRRVPVDRIFGVTTGPETTRYDCREDQVTVRLRRHENHHKRQYQAYGSRIKFWWAYLKDSIRVKSFYNNVFEIAAREAENL